MEVYAGYGAVDVTPCHKLEAGCTQAMQGTKVHVFRLCSGGNGYHGACPRYVTSKTQLTTLEIQGERRAPLEDDEAKVAAVEKERARTATELTERIQALEDEVSRANGEAQRAKTSLGARVAAAGVGEEGGRAAFSCQVGRHASQSKLSRSTEKS